MRVSSYRFHLLILPEFLSSTPNLHACVVDCYKSLIFAAVMQGTGSTEEVVNPWNHEIHMSHSSDGRAEVFRCGAF